MNNRFIGKYEREFLFKYIHETIATNKRLVMLRIRDNGNCDKCGAEENSLHIFYFCENIKPIVTGFRNVLVKMGMRKECNLIDVLMLNFSSKDEKVTNVISLLVSDYLYVLWVSKKKDYCNDQTFEYLKSKLNYSRWTLKCLLKDHISYFPRIYINFEF